MLARLQQVTTLGLLALACAWFGWFATRGRWGWAVLGALLIVVGYAIFLAVELLLLAWQHGDDPTPRAGAAQLWRAWWGEVRTAPRVFCWRQPFRSLAEPDSLPAGCTGATGVLLVHGFVCNRGLWTPWMARWRAEGVPFVAVNLEPVFGSIDDYPPIIEAAMRRLEAATGEKPARWSPTALRPKSSIGLPTAFT